MVDDLRREPISGIARFRHALWLPSRRRRDNAGATPSRDLALLSAGAKLKLANGVSLMAKIDTELGNRSTAYAGTATLQYQF